MSDVLVKLNEYKTKLKGFKELAEETKTKRIRNESKLETLKSSQELVINKIKELGIEPEDLDKVIADNIKILEEITAKLEAAMPDKDGIIDPKAIEALITRPVEPNITVLENNVPVAKISSMKVDNGTVAGSDLDNAKIYVGNIDGQGRIQAMKNSIESDNDFSDADLEDMEI